MNKKAFTTAMFTGLFIFLPLLAFSIFYLNPKMGVMAVTTMLLSLFFTILCLVALIGYIVRMRTSNNELLYIAQKTSLRQGFLFAIYIISILGLASIKLLTWWDALLLALSLALFEIYFSSSREQKHE